MPASTGFVSDSSPDPDATDFVYDCDLGDDSDPFALFHVDHDASPEPPHGAVTFETDFALGPDISSGFTMVEMHFYR